MRRDGAVVVDEEHFSVRYDGPALAEHIMDVRQLAPALIALADAFHRAERVLMPEQQPLSLNVKATEAGSFEIDLILKAGTDVVGHAWEFFRSPDGTSTGSLASLIGTVLAVVALVKTTGRRKFRRQVQTADDPNVTRIEFTDGTTLEIPNEQATLYTSVEFRQHVSDVVAPLQSDGVDTFHAQHANETVEVTRNDIPAFEAPEAPETEDLETTERDVLLQLLGVEFDNKKWRFTEGGATLSASIEDSDFLAKVERQELAFGSQDLLRARLRTRQYRDRSGRLKAEHAIMKVLKHVDGGRQLPLDLSVPTEEPDA